MGRPVYSIIVLIEARSNCPVIVPEPGRQQSGRGLKSCKITILLGAIYVLYMTQSLIRFWRRVWFIGFTLRVAWMLSISISETSRVYWFIKRLQILSLFCLWEISFEISIWINLTKHSNTEDVNETQQIEWDF